eukprot:1511038-Prymnesium_polylepis.1
MDSLEKESFRHSNVEAVPTGTYVSLPGIHQNREIIVGTPNVGVLPNDPNLGGRGGACSYELRVSISRGIVTSDSWPHNAGWPDR